MTALGELQVQARDLGWRIDREAHSRDRARAQLETEAPRHCRCCGTTHIDIQRLTSLCNELSGATNRVAQFTAALEQLQVRMNALGAPTERTA